MHMYTVYILKSLKCNRYYTGNTVDIDTRLKRHNAGFVRSTRSARPWKLVYIEVFGTKTEARKRELQIKSYKGGEAFKKLLKIK